MNSNSQLAFQGNFSPLTSALKQASMAAPANGWVSFDDDSSPAIFGGAAPAAPVAPAAGATVPQPAPTLVPVAPLPGSAPGAPTFPATASAAPAPSRPQALPRPPGTAAGGPPAPSLAGHNFSPLTSSLASSAVQPTFPTFASIHGLAPGTSAPAGAASTPYGSGGAADPGGVGVGVHRLPRPPTSAPRSAATGAGSALNPFSVPTPQTAAAAAPIAGKPASNPFAASANPHGATAAARSLDPFADLSLRPALPRPPPMAAARAATATASGPGPSATSAAALPGHSSAQAPAPSSSTFPTFAALYQQAPTAGRPWPETGGAQPAPALSSSPAGSTPLIPAMAGLPGVRTGVIQTTSFDAFSSPGRAARPDQPAPQPPQQQPQQLGSGFGAFGPPAAPPPSSSSFADAQLPASPRTLPPPPPYEEAVAMSPGLPPPPPYIEAVSMPHAQPLPTSPPPYDEAVAMSAPTTAPAAAAASVAPVADLLGAAGAASSSWATFDDGKAALGPSASTTGGSGAGGALGVAELAGQGSASAASSLQRQSPPPPQPVSLPSQICVEVRLPPLKPKEAAWPKRLAAGTGCAFAAPGGDGVAALQWCLLPGRTGPGQEPGVGAASGPRFDLPAGASSQRASEDWDSAPAVALPLPPALPDSPVTSLLVDDVSCSLWTGHKDGRVVRWSVVPGRAALYEHHWKAHARGKVTCMALSPWGELWTGSSAGSVRSWQYLGALPGSRAPVRLFECRRARLALGPAARSAAQRAHSKTRLMAVGPSGRVLWSAGRTGLALWGAFDGEYLGSLTPGQAPGQEARGAAGAGQSAYAGDTGAVFRDGGWQGQQAQDEINPQTGLDASLINRPFVPRAPPDGGDEAEGDPDLGAQVIKGLAGAAKFANKLRKRIQKNFAGDAQGAVLDGPGPAGDAGYGAVGGGGAATSGGPRGKVVALVAGSDQSMYVAYKCGVLEKYTEWGRLLWTRDYGRHVRLHSATLVGSLLWLGCGDGSIHTVSAATGEPGRSWKAHDFPVAALALGSLLGAQHGVAGGSGGGGGGGLVYSLSENGSVRAWPAAPPSEAHLVAWRDGLLPSLRRRQLTVLAATWNVNETRPTTQSLRTWLTKRAEAAEIVAIALQEVEMGTSSVARDAALTFLSKAMLERGSQNAQWWAAELSSALGQSWVRVALRQMSGVVAVVFVRAELQQHVGEVATAHVACGVMGVGGNKGAVAVSMSVCRRRVMFLSSHFAAHQERVEERNDNYNKIVRQLHFDNTSKAAQRQKQQLLQQAGSAAGGAADGIGDGVADADLDAGGGGAAAAAPSGADAPEDDEQGPGVSDAEMLVWAGDFNYRINGFYSDVCALACAGDYARLYAHDQCRAEMDKGAIFRGLREPLPLGCPVFPPTYKYDKGEPAALLPPAESGGRPRLRLPYDSSEKQRVPAWTDRIFYRGSRPGSLDVAEEEVQVGVADPHDYNCVMEVNESDHKPVYAGLQVQLPAYKQDEKRRHSLAAAIAVGQDPAHGGPSPQHPLRPVQVSSPMLHVRPNGVAALDLHNTSPCGFTVHVIPERPHFGAPTGQDEGRLPGWLEVSPTCFTLLPGQSADGGDRARVLVRALGGDVLRAAESVRLHLSLQPLWGTQTTAGALGPIVTVSLAT